MISSKTPKHWLYWPFLRSEFNYHYYYKDINYKNQNKELSVSLDLPLQSSISMRTSYIPGSRGIIAESNIIIAFLCPDNIF